MTLDLISFNKSTHSQKTSRNPCHRHIVIITCELRRPKAHWSAVAWADKWTSFSQPRGGYEGGNLPSNKQEVKAGNPTCRSHTLSPTARMDVWQESGNENTRLILFRCLRILEETLKPFLNHTSQESGHGNRTRVETSSAPFWGVNSETQLSGSVPRQNSETMGRGIQPHPLILLTCLRTS